MSKRRRELAFGAILALMGAIFAVGVAEAFFRIALFSESFEIPQLKQAWRYADSSFDDDYWKLAFLFRTDKNAQRVGHIHRKLGWVPESSPDNPLGLISDKPYRLGDIQRPILFYGDSFVAGATPIPDRIPQVMDRLLPERSVLNYGVGGYGLDQIYLRFLRTAGEFENPVVLIGILTLGLDRSILAIRTGQKPYLDIEDDTLIVRNTPILPTTKAYIDRNPPHISSYFLRFVLFRMRPLIPKKGFDRLMGYDQKHSKRLQVNRRLLAAFKEEAEGSRLRLYTVIFFSRQELQEKGEREQFLEGTLRELEIPFFHTKDLLLDYMAKTGRSQQDLYYDENGHPNERGNRVIAEGIIEWLDSFGAL